jgi:hypothetical protein
MSRVAAMQNEEGNSIFLLTETKTDNPQLPPLLTLATPSKGSSGGVAILYPKGIAAHSAHLVFPTKDAPTVTAVAAVMGSLVLVSVYVKCNLTETALRSAQTGFTSFLGQFAQSDLIVGGDLNTPTEARITSWVDALRPLGLERLDSEPTFVCPSGKSSTLDHFFVSGQYSGLQVDRLESLVDHHALRLITAPRDRLPLAPGVPPPKADYKVVRPWNSPLGILQRKLAAPAVAAAMKKAGKDGFSLSFLGDAAVAGVLSFAPNRPVPPRSTDPVWWNAPLGRARLALEAAERAGQAPGVIALKRDYLAQLCDATRLAHEAVAASSSDPVTRREVRERLGAPSRRSSRPPASRPSPSAAVASLEAAFSAPAGIPDGEEREARLRNRLAREGRSSHWFTTVTKWDVFRALRRLNKKSCPGEDHLHPLILQTAPAEWAAVLAEVINSIIETATWPEDHKHSTASMIPKKDGGWRVICVGTVMSKLVELVLLDKLVLNRKFDPVKFFGENQVGFQRGIGAMEPHILLALLIDHVTGQGDDLVILGLDVQRAFDSVSHVSILEGLLDAGLSYRDTRLLASFLGFFGSERTMAPKGVPGVKVPQRVGVPCGAVLAPILYLVANRLAYALACNPRLSGVQVLGKRLGRISYADDETMIAYRARGKGPYTQWLSLTDAFYGDGKFMGMQRSLARQGLVLNPAKFEAMGGRTAARADFPVKGGVVPTQASVKLLGSFQWNGVIGEGAPPFKNTNAAVFAQQRFLSDPSVPLAVRAAHFYTVILPSTLYPHLASTHLVARRGLAAAERAAWEFVLDAKLKDRLAEARAFVGAREAVHELDYARAIRLIDAVRTTTVNQAHLTRLLLLEAWNGATPRPGADAAIDLFMALSPNQEVRGGPVSTWMSLLLGDGNGALLALTASKTYAKGILRKRFRQLYPPHRCPAGARAAGANASSLFAFATNFYPSSAPLAPPHAQARRLCLVCFQAMDCVHHLLDCEDLLPPPDGPLPPPAPTAGPAGGPPPEAAPLDAGDGPLPEVIPFGESDAGRFLAKPSERDLRGEYAALLRTLGPHTAAHLRIGAAEAASTAAALLDLRNSRARLSLNRSSLVLCIGAAGPDRVTFAHGPAPVELAPLVAYLAESGLRLTQLTRAPSLTPFGAFLAAVRRAKGAPAPTGPEVAAFKATVLAMTAGSGGARFRAALGRGALFFRARKDGRLMTADPLPPLALNPEDEQETGDYLVRSWATGAVKLTGFTLAALAYASVTSPAAGPGLEASPEFRGYGLAASFDWLEVGRKDRVPYHMSAPATAPVFLGSFVRDAASGVVYMVTRRPVPQAFPPALAGPAGPAPAAPARLARKPSAGIQHPGSLLF